MDEGMIRVLMEQNKALKKEKTNTMLPKRKHGGYMYHDRYAKVRREEVRPERGFVVVPNREDK